MSAGNPNPRAAASLGLAAVTAVTKAALATRVAFALAAVGLAGCASQLPDPRPPIEVDRDMADIAEPREIPPNQYYDFLDRTFTKQIHQSFDMPRNFRKLAGKPKQAENVTSFGEVPSSSWFTNRNGRERLPVDAIRRGPNTGTGPAPGFWTVIRGKTEGVTPGFTIVDETGQRFIIKFDPASNPEMSSAAEMISTKLFWAIGFHTPENHLVHWTRDRLRVAEDAKISDALGNKRRMTGDDLEEILARVARRDDGSYRTIASRFLDGVPKGPYSYHGTRGDDPNDIIDHEHRRELRGLRIFSAWLEHNDVRRINSLDVYVTEGDRSFLRHYLIDFGATLGSASLFPNQAWEGHEYIFDFGETLKSLFSLGLYERQWRKSPEVEYPTVGLYEAELFHPSNWKPNYPNPAFENMTALDAYWAAKIVMSFTDDQIRAAVGEGRLSNPAAADYLARTIMARRDAIGRTWYAKVNALDDFRLEGDAVAFDDLEVDAGFTGSRDTRYRWRFVVHTPDGDRTVGEEREVRGTRVSLERAQLDALRSGPGSEGRHATVSIRSLRPDRSESWSPLVHVHLWQGSGGDGLRIVGVDHES